MCSSIYHMVRSAHANMFRRRHLDRFIRFCRAGGRDQYADREIDRLSDHRTSKVRVRVDHICAMNAMWPNTCMLVSMLLREKYAVLSRSITFVLNVRT